MKPVLTFIMASMLLFAMQTASAGVVVIVNADSNIESLAKEDVSDIFLAKKSSFPSGAAAVPVDQKENSAERESFYTEVAGMSGRQVQSYWSRLVFSGKGKPPAEISSGAEVVSMVAANPDMIGYVDSSLVNDSVKVVLTP